MSELPLLTQELLLSGKARLEVRPIAILGEGSLLAARAAECAGEQGRFWEYHDILYANQKSERRGGFSSDELKAFAAALSLDASVFDPCLDSGKYAESVRLNTAIAGQRGVSSTPSIFVDGVRVENSADAVLQAVEAKLQPGS